MLKDVRVYTQSATRVILILEDDLDAREMLATMLSGRGMTILQASNITDAQAILEETDVSVLLTDFYLGGDTASDLLDRLPAKHKPGKVVLVSGRTFASPPNGVDVVLPKPFRMNKLIEAVS